ncbi:MAG: hypothetical protein JNL35_02695 [Sphingopyxis sp.]|nr:hypothetical protein [Sphingopyxis sp.]
MQVGLKSGIWTAVLGLAGGGAVVIWPDARWVGYLLLGFAALALVWGVTIRGKSWWARRGKPNTMQDAVVLPSGHHRTVVDFDGGEVVGNFIDASGDFDTVLRAGGKGRGKFTHNIVIVRGPDPENNDPKEAE